MVLGSGDKLLGGPQCGIIVGNDGCVGKIRNHPLARAVRVDKLTLAALGATLDSYTRDEARSEIPTQAMLFATMAELQSRAVSIREEIADVPGLRLSIREDLAQVGGGSLPAVELPTVVIALQHPKISADELSRRLRTGRIGVFARIQSDEVLLDIRSVLPEDDSRLADCQVQSLSRPLLSNSVHTSRRLRPGPSENQKCWRQDRIRSLSPHHHVARRPRPGQQFALPERDCESR